MNPTLVQFLRCPRCREAVSVWDVSEEDKGDIVEGTLACDACGGTYRIHSTLPVLLPTGRRAVDDLATILAWEAESGGFAEAVRRLADGSVPYPLERPFEPAVSAIEAREGRYRASPAFWATFSRNRLIQQQINAIDRHWDALEEVWLRADVNFADTVLDVGTGWGGTFLPLLEAGPRDALVYGLDTAFLNLRIAQGRAEREQHTHAAIVVGDCVTPPFQPGLFDSAVSWFGVGSVPRFRDCLIGLQTVLGSGCAFACAWTPLVNDMEGLADSDDLRRLAERLDIPVGADAAAATMEEAGFTQVEMVTAGPIFILSGRAGEASE
jgi:uncharacterized protein YbaR (Trm112 family)/ubiquinone/menaquinone biosynthesis C-methylase UbiE